MKSDVEEARVLAADKGNELETYPDYEPGLKERDIRDLWDERQQAQETAARYEEIHTKITEIKTKVDEAKTDDTVETAITERDRTLRALEDQLTGDYEAMVGDVLVDHVQETTMDASRPAVFQRAREILATITRGRYRLDLDEDE